MEIFGYELSPAALTAIVGVLVVVLYFIIYGANVKMGEGFKIYNGNTAQTLLADVDRGSRYNYSTDSLSENFSDANLVKSVIGSSSLMNNRYTPRYGSTADEAADNTSISAQ